MKESLHSTKSTDLEKSTGHRETSTRGSFARTYLRGREGISGVMVCSTKESGSKDSSMDSESFTMESLAIMRENGATA